MSKPARIVAFLACMWFPPSHIPSITRIYTKRGETLKGRAELNARFLFFRSLTGKRIKDAFGEDLIERIIWEESTKEFATESNGCPPADPDHIRIILRFWKPDIVVTFGKIARYAVEAQLPKGVLLCPIPHPAARHGHIVPDLNDGARLLESQIKDMESR